MVMRLPAVKREISVACEEFRCPENKPDQSIINIL